MKGIPAVLACACVGLTLSVAAAGGLGVGVADDSGKYDEDGGASFFARMNEVGLTENRITIYWNADRPTQIVDKGFLDRALPQAAAHGVRIVFSVSVGRPASITSDTTAPAAFVRFLQLLARTYPEVREYIVGNEPNQPRFWQPQFVPGRPDRSAGAAYEALLARAYDGLKAVDPQLTVVGLALAPRGNDRPGAREHVSTSPVRFLHDMGVAYRASGRKRPLMDQLGFHVYPAVNTDAPAKGDRWPNAGPFDLDRIKQTVWDAFHGTAQPTFAEAGTALGGSQLTFKLDEAAWQVDTRGLDGYRGAENVPTISPVAQAEYYLGLLRRFACDPSVSELLFFHLLDEPERTAFQSGFFDRAGNPRPVRDAIRAELARTGGRCSGRVAQWRHEAGVVGAAASFGADGIRLRAEEAAAFSAALYRVDGPGDSPSKLRRSLASARGREVSRSSGTLRAYAPRVVRIAPAKLAPGWYAPGVRLTAALGPGRTTFFAGAPFRVE